MDTAHTTDTMFMIGSILRYHPESSDVRYTAIVKDREIVEVKRAGETVKQSWGTVEEWLDSLPGSPSIQDLVVEKGLEEEKVGKGKAGKAGKGKGKGKEKEKKEVFRLFPTREHVPATRWTAHLHRIIKEAQPLLLKDPAVISAFNALIDVLLKHQRHIHSFVPNADRKYLDGINLDTHPHDPLRDICTVHWDSIYQHAETGQTVIRSRHYRTHDSNQGEDVVREEVVTVYRVLFDLIKGDVLPYVKQKAEERASRQRGKDITRYMEHMERLQVIYDAEMERRRLEMKQAEELYERRMNRYRDLIADLAVSSTM